MRVPKEIAEKADEYERLKRREEQLCEELTAWACENGFEDLYVDGFGVSQEPEGEEQVDVIRQHPATGRTISQSKIVQSICGLSI